MIFILSAAPEKARTEYGGYVLKLLLASFFSLVVTSYLFSVLSGELVCARAVTAHEFLGSAMATAVVTMIVALSWMVLPHDSQGDTVVKFLRSLIYFSLFLIAGMLLLSSIAYVNGMDPQDDHDTLAGLMALFTLSGFIAFVWISRVYRKRATSEATSPWNHRRSVNWLAWGALAYLAVASSATAITLSFPPAYWKPEPADSVVYTVGWLALVLPMIVLGISVGAIARQSSLTPNTKASRN
ncbi:hypothetical protein [Spirillospora sp. NPDC048824]|uniref:hypothetical protein n=1 Tax=Spirillospora sp. NPDC048824 TaxID=3364526 RepID=UPI003718118F